MFKAVILALSRQLYPTGRAFKMPSDGYLESLHKALGESENTALEAADNILNSIIPDNAFFTVEDARLWEQKLGLITNESISLEDRKKAIARKMSYPGRQKARQHYTYIQSQLNKAGFDVVVYENIFNDGSGYYTKHPLLITGGTGGETFEHGDFELGVSEYGSYWSNFVANKIDEAKDLNYSIPDDLEGTFFIGGITLGAYASIDINRKQEFRQLILKVKPANTVAFLFINYV